MTKRMTSHAASLLRGTSPDARGDRRAASRFQVSGIYTLNTVIY